MKVKKALTIQTKNIEKIKKPRKAKKEKDPNKPKRPLSGYMLFMQDNRSNFKKEMPGAKMVEISKIAGEKWKTLPENEKKVYYIIISIGLQ
jgi:hypothetical protein